jgi:hypothetical protein
VSNGAIAAACCCTEECETDCCDWWACSPAGPITVTLSGSAIVERKILPSASPTTLIVKEVYWTITATMTKSGTTCDFAAAGSPSLNWPNLFRFSAQQVDFSYQRIERTYDVGSYHVCQNFCPPQCCTADYTDSGCLTNIQGGLSNTDPCACGTDFMCDDPLFGGFLALTSTNPCLSWNCGSAMGANCADGEVTGDNIPVGCTDCGCPQTVDDIVFKLIETKEWNWTGTILAPGFCAESTCGDTCDESPCDRGPLDDTGVPYKLTTLARSNQVLAIACVEGYCKEGCAKPVLVFRPSFAGATGSGTYERWSGDPTDWPDNRDPCCVDCEGDDSSCYSSEAWTPCIEPFAVLGKGNCLNGSTFDAPTLGCDSHPAPVFNNVLCTGSDDMAGKGGCQPCTALTGTFPEGEYCPPTGKGSFYFCATAGNSCFIPCNDANGKLVEFPGTVCYWPAWCESDERTIQWTWSL